MGDAFGNWYESYGRATDRHREIARDAEVFRSLKAVRGRSLLARLADELGRRLISLGRALRRAAGAHQVPERCGCYGHAAGR